MGNTLEGAKSEDKKEIESEPSESEGFQAVRAFTCCCAPATARIGKMTPRGTEDKTASGSSDLWGRSRGIDFVRVPETDGSTKSYIAADKGGRLLSKHKDMEAALKYGEELLSKQQNRNSSTIKTTLA
eukprot:757745-Hanusia_phi.AAC.9